MIQVDPNISEKKKSFLIKRAKSFVHAGRGVWIFIKDTPNVWVHGLVLCGAVMLGVYLHITQLEWLVLILVSALVLVAEAINTAIEIDIDLTSPEYHPFARDTKDVAAGSVLLASIAALVVGAVVFVPYLF